MLPRLFHRLTMSLGGIWLGLLVASSAGVAAGDDAAVNVTAVGLPPLAVEAWRFPAAGVKQAVALSAMKVGDVVSLSSSASLTAGEGWWHNILIRRPAITATEAMPPADGSGLNETVEMWNKDGWGNPHSDSYDPSVLGLPLVDLGRREPFFHPLSAGQAGSVRTFDFVLDAPGVWLFKAEVVDEADRAVGVAPTVTITVANPPLAGDPASLTYPFGRPDRFVGVFWNAGQAHRLWTTWRADHQWAYGATWAVNWKLMWKPSLYFTRWDGELVRPDPVAESPWNPFWSAHQVYALVPDGLGGSRLTHDITSRAFAEKAALRLMEVGVDFVAIDYSNQFLEEVEDVLPAMTNLAHAFAAVAPLSQSKERVRLSALLPIGVDSGDWGANGGFIPSAIAKFNAKLTTLYERFARSESAWFFLEDDNGVRRPLLMLWIGATGAGDAEGKLPADKLRHLKLADGRLMTDVFTIRWVGALLTGNPRFASTAGFTVDSPDGLVTGKYFKPEIWSYREHAVVGASLAADQTAALSASAGAAPAVEMVIVQPNTFARDRFGREWQENWPAGAGFHYETLAKPAPIPLTEYGRLWHNSLNTARALNPKILMTIWAEFGSENDEPRPEMAVTVMDNNKYGTHFGDALRRTVRLFKYQEPQCWIETFTHAGKTSVFAAVAPAAWRMVPLGATVRLQGWVTPNVATAFADGSVKVYVDDILHGTATVGGALDGGTRWYFDLATLKLGIGQHAVKVVAEDGVGGSFQAGYQFRGEGPRNLLALVVDVPEPPAGWLER